MAFAVDLAGMTHNLAGDSVRTDTGYALKLRDGQLVPVTEQQFRSNSRAERQVFLGAAIFGNAWGGALCWGAKMRDNEDEPL